MRESPDPWHYARPQLAAQYLAQFDIGLISAVALFAKRRMGKSEFLEQDLIPAAQGALQRLEREELVIRIERGEYALQDEVFLEWVRGGGPPSPP